MDTMRGYDAWKTRTPAHWEYPEEVPATFECPECDTEGYDDYAAVEAFYPNRYGYEAEVRVTCQACRHEFTAEVSEEPDFEAMAEARAEARASRYDY